MSHYHERDKVLSLVRVDNYIQPEDTLIILCVRCLDTGYSYLCETTEGFTIWMKHTDLCLKEESNALIGFLEQKKDRSRMIMEHYEPFERPYAQHEGMIIAYNEIISELNSGYFRPERLDKE